MRVILSAYACEPGRGSEPGNGWNWAVNLAARGHTVELLTTPNERALIDGRIRTQGIQHLRPHYIEYPSSRLRRLSGQAGVYEDYTRWMKGAALVARELEADADVIHHVTWGSVYWGSYYRSDRIPYIHGPVGGGQVAPPGFHELIGSGSGRERARSFVASHFSSSFPGARRIIQSANVILATNPETRSLLSRLGARRVQMMLAEGIDESMIQPAPRTGPPSRVQFLWVGRFYGIKSPILALRAFAIAAEQHPDATLVMVGDGPQLADAKQLAEELNVTKRVAFTGWIPWQEVQELYRSATALIFSSLRDSFGAQCLEAAAAGLPMVVLNHHGVGYSLPEDAAMKVEVTTASAVVTEMGRSLTRMSRMGTEDWQALSIGALRYAQGHTWTAQTEAAEKIYAETIEGFGG